jgi:organic hydroperoxide reductase OsmC/OhrA
MIQYPMTFKVSSEARSGISQTWETRAESMSAPIAMSIPPEFSGPGGGYSPEDLYAAALTNCFVATFKVFAEKSRIGFEAMTIKASLTVDRNESGVPWMKAVHLAIHLAGATDLERARHLLEKTSQSCMILNSVKTEKTFEFQVS